MNVPIKCPSCDSGLKVRKMYCEKCGTEVEGKYPLPPLAQLSWEEQSFILQFVKLSGSLKDIAESMKLSYPTVRNRLDEIVHKIELLEKGKKP